MWHEALWATMKLYNININLITVIQTLYEKATSAVCFNNSIGDWFKTSVGVRQGCLLSPTLFDILLERIMTDTLEDHAGTVSIGGRTTTNLRFADDIDGRAGTETELASLVERLDKTSTAYGMRIRIKKAFPQTSSVLSLLANSWRMAALCLTTTSRRSPLSTWCCVSMVAAHFRLF